MKHYIRRLFTLLTALVCIGLLAGCGTDTAENDTSDSSADTPASSDTADDAATETEAPETEDIIGQVTYVSDSYIRLDLCESDTEITDYTDLGSAVLTNTDSSETVILDSDAVFEYVSSGILYSTTVDGVTEGDFIAVTATEDGIQEIIVLDYAAPAQSEETPESTDSPEEAGEESSTEDSGTSGDTTEDSSQGNTEDSDDSTLVTAAV